MIYLVFIFLIPLALLSAAGVITGIVALLIPFGLVASLWYLVHYLYFLAFPKKYEMPLPITLIALTVIAAIVFRLWF